MQTFYPYIDAVSVAKCLDYRRLGKQRVEVLQILQCLLIKPTQWQNHPAVKMWKGYEAALAKYGIIMCEEWIKRGYKDTCKLKIWMLWSKCWDKMDPVIPPWLGDEVFHRSHQSNLVRKYPEHYRKYFPNVPNDLLYYWPTKDNTYLHELRRVI